VILQMPKSEREEIGSLLSGEGVTFRMGDMVSIREMGTGSFEVYTITANVEEIQVPPLYRSSDGEVRAFRLPSGKLILTDLEGNLERVETPRPQ
jgi:hypothetical protein